MVGTGPSLPAAEGEDPKSPLAPAPRGARGRVGRTSLLCRMKVFFLLC